MDARLNPVIELLDSIGNQLSLLGEERGANAILFPGTNRISSLNFFQLSAIPRNIINSINRSNNYPVASDFDDQIKSLIKTLSEMEKKLTDLFRLDPPSTAQWFITMMSYVDMTLSSMFSWWGASSKNLPNSLARKIERISSELDQLIPEKETIERQLSTLASAKDIITNINVDMEKYRDSQNRLRNLAKESSTLHKQIQDTFEKSQSYSVKQKELADEATALVKQASEVYRLATSTALAAAFQERAKKLEDSVTKWVFLLGCTLSIILIIGWVRLSVMQQLFLAPSFEAPKVWFNLALSLFWVGAPIWFAWVSTKQIAQRFRLSEDYAFKASVSAAYEGYRREAKRIDPEFEKALFASALSRLDEAPLRLLEIKTPGSPLHEMAESTLVRVVTKGLVDRIPSLQRKAKENPARSE